MLNNPFGVGVARRPLPVSGLFSPVRPGFVVAIPVRDEEERLPACLQSLALQRDRLGVRFRQRWFASSYLPTIVPIRAQASLESSAERCRLTSGWLKLDCLLHPPMLGQLVAR